MLTAEHPAEVEQIQDTEQCTKTQDTEPAVISGAVFKALTKCTDDATGRFSLDGLRVKGRQIEAADGAILARVTVPDGQSFGPERTYDPNGHRPKKRETLSISPDDGELHARSDGHITYRLTESEEQSWPNTDSIIPPTMGRSVKLRINNIQRVLDVLEAVKRQDCQGPHG